MTTNKLVSLRLDSEDLDLIIYALHVRRCVIETGNPILSRNDAIERKKFDLIRDLSDEQHELLRKHNALIALLQARLASS